MATYRPPAATIGADATRQSRGTEADREQPGRPLAACRCRKEPGFYVGVVRGTYLSG